MLPCIVAFLFMPEKYIDIEGAIELKRKQDEQTRQIVSEHLDEPNEKKELDIY